MPDHQPLRQDLRRHGEDIARLALPVVGSRMGMITLMIVDTMMVGRFSSQELAYQGIGSAPIMTVLVTCFGLLTGTLVMTSVHMGAGEPKRTGAVWRRSLGYALVLGVLGLVISLFGENILLATGQSADLARGGGEIVMILGFGIPSMLIFIASGYFLEGLKRPMPGLVLTIIGNVINVFLNWVLVYGHIGFDAMGAAGSAWATFGVRCFMGVGLVIYILTMTDRGHFGVLLRPEGGWRSWSQQRRIGYGAGVSSAVESSAFSSMSIFAGLLGVLALGAFSVAFQLLALFFMVALGIGTATAVCVGHALGAKKPRDIAFAGWTGLAINSLVMAGFGIVLILTSVQLAAIFTTDPALIERAAPMIAFVSYVLVADGGQAVMAQALRGRAETWAPAAMHIVSYLVIMIPLAWLLTQKLDRGPIGLFESILIASVVSLALLSLRYWWLGRGDEARFKTPRT